MAQLVKSVRPFLATPARQPRVSVQETASHP